MAFDLSGTFTRIHNWVTDRNGGVKIRADRMDAEFDGVATALGMTLLRDGRAPATGDIDLGNHKITGLAAGSANGNALRYEQLSALLSGGAADPTLIALAALAWSSGKQFPVFTAADTLSLQTITDAALTFLQASSATAQAALLTPVGKIADYAGSAAPSGWLLCYGQAISRSTYSALYTAIGTAFGVGDGSTTFNVPDLRGRVAAGKDDMGGSAASRLTNSGTGNPGVNGASLGASGGVDRHTLTTAQMPSHNHGGASGSSGDHAHQEYVFAAQSGAGLTYDYQVSGGAYTAGNVAQNTATAGAHTHTISSNGSSEAHPNVQPTLVLNKIIFAGV